MIARAMRKFQRRIEDFTCARCGQAVTGTGYTNHCPACLWSLHVDQAPGDRAADCQGPMRPVGADQRGGDWFVLHECERCGFRRPNRVTPAELPVLIRLMRAGF